ncbi:MAG: hypothetical protein WBA73_02780 [Devosia sp.]
MRVQVAYLQQVKNKAIPEGPTPAGIEATQHMLKAWGHWKYRLKYFDKDLEKGRFDNIGHTVVKLENEAPVVAASSFFATAPYQWGKVFGVILNIIPTSATETAVVVSYADAHSAEGGGSLLQSSSRRIPSAKNCCFPNSSSANARTSSSSPRSRRAGAMTNASSLKPRTSKAQPPASR